MNENPIYDVNEFQKLFNDFSKKFDSYAQDRMSHEDITYDEILEEFKDEMMKKGE